jgi:uncharacterized delta-60 repeat protein
MDIQADGRLVVVSTGHRPGGGKTGLALRRFTRSGRIDRSFGGRGLTRVNEIGWGTATGIASDGQGRSFVSAFSGEGGQNERQARAVLFAFKKSGRPDTRFGENGRVGTARDFHGESTWFNDVTVDRRGRPLVVGSVAGRGEKGRERDWLVARYTRTGRPDPNFGEDGVRVIDVSGIGRRSSSWIDADDGLRIRLAPDGKIVLGGQASRGAAGQFAAVRLNTDGSLDRHFGDAGVARYYLLDRLSSDRWWAQRVRVTDVAVGPDGRVAISSGMQVSRMVDDGYGTAYVNIGSILLLGRDGKPIRSFGRRGFLRDFVDFEGLAFDRCNRLLAGGLKAHDPDYEDLDDFSLSRFTKSGARDRSFAPKGTISFAVGRRHRSFLSEISVRRNRIFAAGQSLTPDLNRGMAIAAIDASTKCR